MPRSLPHAHARIQGCGRAALRGLWGLGTLEAAYADKSGQGFLSVNEEMLMMMPLRLEEEAFVER